MRWAEIKTAVNSTLATEDFLPFDKYFKNRIMEEQYMLRASDDVLEDYQEDIQEFTPDIDDSAEEHIIDYQYKCHLNGYAKIKLSYSMTGYNNSNSTWQVLNNGVVVGEKTLNYNSGAGERELNVHFHIGDVLTFRIITSYQRKLSAQIFIYATRQIETIKAGI